MVQNPLFPENILQEEQQCHEPNKEKQYPSGSLVLLLLPLPVFPVHPHYYQDEDQDKEQGKNDLTGAEHISYF
jgi:hypothetical protein